MPHYNDGTEAKVGDQVFGKLYNTEGIQSGVIISITKEVDSCNAMVQFTKAIPVNESVDLPRMSVSGLVRMVRTANHCSEGPMVYLFTCADYCSVNELIKVGP